MKFAYLILAHRYPSQLSGLVNQLQDGENYFFIHIDKKVDQEFFQKQKYLIPENVFFCTNRVNVNWGGFSQVEATLHLIRDFIEKNIYCEYVHLISGQDFPIKANEYIKKFFEQNAGKNYIDYFALPYEHWDFGGFDRIQYQWMIDEIGIQNAKMQVKNQKTEGKTLPFPEGYGPYGGSQWWSLTYECVKYIAKTCRPGHILYNFYQTTMIPDEMFFQTLLMHSEFKNTIENTNLRYIDWNIIGAVHPKCLLMEDFDKLKQSENLFARKFNDEIDYKVRYRLKYEILTCIWKDRTQSFINL